MKLVQLVLDLKPEEQVEVYQLLTDRLLHAGLIGAAGGAALPPVDVP